MGPRSSKLLPETGKDTAPHHVCSCAHPPRLPTGSPCHVSHTVPVEASKTTLLGEAAHFLSFTMLSASSSHSAPRPVICSQAKEASGVTSPWGFLVPEPESRAPGCEIRVWGWPEGGGGRGAPRRLVPHLRKARPPQIGMERPLQTVRNRRGWRPEPNGRPRRPWQASLAIFPMVS